MAHRTVSVPWDGELVPTPEGRTAAPSPDCPVEVALTAVSGRWTTLVLRDLMSGGALSYSQLAESPPRLSDEVVTDRLNDLVDTGPAERRVSPGFPRRTRYRLTGTGLLLRPLPAELYRTGTALQEGAGAEAGRPQGAGPSPGPGALPGDDSARS